MLDDDTLKNWLPTADPAGEAELIEDLLLSRKALKTVVAAWLGAEYGYDVRSHLGASIRWNWLQEPDSPEHIEQVTAWAYSEAGKD